MMHSGLTYSRVFRLPMITLTQNGAKAEQNTNCKISIFFQVYHWPTDAKFLVGLWGPIRVPNYPLNFTPRQNLKFVNRKFQFFQGYHWLFDAKFWVGLWGPTRVPNYPSNFTPRQNLKFCQQKISIFSRVSLAH